VEEVVAADIPAAVIANQRLVAAVKGSELM